MKTENEYSEELVETSHAKKYSNGIDWDNSVEVEEFEQYERDPFGLNNSLGY